jgi:hypothetical protein
MKKLVKKKVETIKKYQKEADKLFQEIGRKIYSDCFVCGRQMSCLHHFVKKSQSTGLRYNLKNAIPLCVKCHCSIHQGLNDMVVGQIVALKGVDWLSELEIEKKHGLGLKFGVIWYKEQVRRLKLVNPYKV